MPVPLSPDRHLFHDFDSEAFQRHDTPGVVGQQPYSVEAEVRQDLRAQPNFVLQGRMRDMPVMANNPRLLRAQSEASLMKIDQRPEPASAMRRSDPRTSAWHSHCSDPKISP